MVVCDNRPNLLVALCLSRLTHLPCLAHVMTLVVPPVVWWLCRPRTAYFPMVSFVMFLHVGIPYIHLCGTDMMEYQMQITLYGAWVLADLEMKDICSILCPFEEATEMVGCDQQSSGSLPPGGCTRICMQLLAFVPFVLHDLGAVFSISLICFIGVYYNTHCHFLYIFEVMLYSEYILFGLLSDIL